MTLPEFENEDRFRREFIAPLLSKLGYILVTHSHGDWEQGKDFFFADFDRFEHIRIYSVQAKHGNIGAGDVEVQKLWNQVDRSFRVPLRLYKGVEHHRVSGVYIMASGRISPTARDAIVAYCATSPYGENVFFLDGERLDQINRGVTFRVDASIRNRLVGLLLEATANLEIITKAQNCLENAENQVHVGRFRTGAMEAALAVPIPTAILDAQRVDPPLTFAHIANRMTEAALQLGGARRLDELRKVLPMLWEEVIRLRDAADDGIKLLDARHKIVLTCESVEADAERPKERSA